MLVFADMMSLAFGEGFDLARGLKNGMNCWCGGIGAGADFFGAPGGR